MAVKEEKKKGGFPKKSFLLFLFLYVFCKVLASLPVGEEASTRLELPLPLPKAMAAPSVRQLNTLEDREDNLDVLKTSSTSITWNDWIPGDEDLEEVQSAIEALRDDGYDTGFVLMDLNSGRAMMYNADQEFYSASTVKAFYVASLADAQPQLLNTAWADTMQAALVWSDNEAYGRLRDTYKSEYVSGWMEKAGVDGSKGNERYPYCSAREMAKLWVLNDWWFDHDEAGRKTASFYETPNMSSIRKLVDPSIRTRTKAGWIFYEDPYLSATNDGGIIYEPEHPYLLSVMTTAPQEFEELDGIVKALIHAHEDMVEGME